MVKINPIWFRKISGYYEGYSVIRTISYCFLTLLVLSLVGGIPILNRKLLLLFSLGAFAVGQIANPNWKDIRMKINEFLLGFLSGSMVQSAIFPLSLIREFDFLFIVVGLSAAIGMVMNRNHEFSLNLAKIAVCSGASLVAINFIGGFFVNNNYLTKLRTE